MATESSSPLSSVLLTTDDLHRLEDECAALNKEIEHLEERRVALATKLKAINDLLTVLGIDPNARRAHAAVHGPAASEKPEIHEPHEIQAPSAPEATNHLPLRTRLDDGSYVTWMGEISRIVSEREGPVSYDEIKEAILSGPLAAKMEASDKGFYGAIAKLVSRDALVKKSGYLFSPQAYAKFVQSGEIENLAKIVRERIGAAKRGGPLASAVLEVVRAHPTGVIGNEVIAELLKNPSFSESIRKNNTGAYNVLTRLISHGQIKKVGRTYFPIAQGADGEAFEMKFDDPTADAGSSDEKGPAANASSPIKSLEEGDQTGAD